MSDLICVTNRKLCTGDYLTRIEEIAKQHPKGILLREKDLSPLAYTQLAKKVLAICKRHQTLCILHNFIETAEQTGCPAIHLPLPVLRNMTEQQKRIFPVIGSIITTDLALISRFPASFAASFFSSAKAGKTE